MYFLIKKGINKNPVCYYFFNFTNGFSSKCLVIRCAFIKHILMIFRLLSAAWNSKAGYLELRHVFDGAARISEGQPQEVDMSFGWPILVWTYQECTGPPAWRTWEGDGESLQYVNPVTFRPRESWITSQPQLC